MGGFDYSSDSGNFDNSFRHARQENETRDRDEEDRMPQRGY